MSLYEKKIFKKWFLFIALFFIFKYPLSKFLGNNDIYYNLCFTYYNYYNSNIKF